MKSRQAILTIATLALIGSAIPAFAQSLSYAPADTPQRSAGVRAIQGASDREATRVEAAGRLASDSRCRELNPMQSWGYESCLQQLPASAAMGGR
jgi:hypothetical protein